MPRALGRERESVDLIIEYSEDTAKGTERADCTRSEEEFFEPLPALLLQDCSNTPHFVATCTTRLRLPLELKRSPHSTVSLKDIQFC